jgi:hypothetical protein
MKATERVFPGLSLNPEKGHEKMNHTTQDLQTRIVAGMKTWERVGRQFSETAARITRDARNPDVVWLMKRMRRELSIHRRAEQFISDSLSSNPFPLDLAELEEIWGMVEKHIQLLSRMIEITEQITASGRENLLSQSRPSLSPALVQ